MKAVEAAPKVNGKSPYVLLNKEEENSNIGNAMWFYKRGYMNAVSRLNHMEMYNNNIRRDAFIVIFLSVTIIVSLTALVWLSK